VNEPPPTKTESVQQPPPIITPIVQKENTRPKTTFNLNSIGKTVPKAEEKKIEEKTLFNTIADKPVELAALKKAWDDFTELKKNQLGEYHLLKREFTFHENKITITLTNSIEEPLLQGMRTSLIAYLRDKLSNSSIMVVGVLPEFESKRPIYTNKEKFDHLAEKNPVLKELQERFGLDPDF